MHPPDLLDEELLDAKRGQNVARDRKETFYAIAMQKPVWNVEVPADALGEHADNDDAGAIVILSLRGLPYGIYRIDRPKSAASNPLKVESFRYVRS